ncbi:MAG: hypothetical protein H0V07_14835 [Propionibacteriales bacterium]|nr:hypothetical protein [Propionibacteriales bacterium]
MTTNPPDEPAYSRWTWPTGPEDVPGGTASRADLSPRARRLGWFISGAGLVIVVAAMLPWKTIGPDHFNGTMGDGLLTGAFGLVAAAAGLGRVLTRREGRWTTIWPAVALTMATFTCLIAYTDVLAIAEIAPVGIGLLLTFVSGIGLAVASVIALLRRI